MLSRLLIILLVYSHAAAETRVLFLGDSITAGYGLSLDEAYPAVVETLSEGKITSINAGISGDTTAGGIGRVKWLLDKHNPDALFIALGANDGLRGFPTELIQKNLTRIIEIAREQQEDIKIYLAGIRMPPTYGEEYGKEFEAVFEKTALANKVLFYPKLLGEVAGDEKLNQPDGIHPTNMGQRIIAEKVWVFLKDKNP